jgi:hypothetical protein
VQHLGINIKKILTVTAISLLLSGCTWLNPLIYYEGKSGSRDTLPVAVEELIEMAEYCDEAYENREENYGVKSGEFSYTVKQNEGITILVFRGTSNLKNVRTDIDMRFWKDDGLTDHWGIDINLHRGFKDAAMWILEDIEDNYKLEKTVYLTGHSLGGAIAQIMGLWLDAKGYNVQIYTFGSPKVSTTFFGSKPSHYRVALRNDPVPFVPMFPFLHSGISIDPETLDWMEGGETDRDSFTEIDGRDHSIGEYVDILKERLKN